MEDENGDVVTGLTAVALDRRLSQPLGDLVRALAGAVRDLLGEPVGIVALAAIADVENPVGVEDQRVAHAQSPIAVRDRGGGESPQEGAGLADRFDLAGLPKNEGKGVTPERDGEAGGAASVGGGLG